MYSMQHDDLDHIPSIVPTRDGVPQRNIGKSSADMGERRRSPSPQKQPASMGITGLLARLIIGVSLLVAVLACVWAWQLQAQLQEANEHISNYATRIGDLEARLSDTDEGMSQNAAVQAAKVAKLESEVRKIWDNVWKETKDRLGKLESAGAAHGKGIKGLEASQSTTQSQLRAASDDVAKLNSVAGDLARLIASAKANQAEVERVADSLNRIELALAKLDKRVATNEEWVGSVNAFRKQVNTSLGELQSAVKSMQATSAQQP
jgi:chromosome segregation ATPase